MLVIHHDDLDGKCAAAIMQYAQPSKSVEFYPIQYGDDFSPDITKDRVVAILDFSFKPDVMSKIVENAERVIWCDHHKTAKDYNYNVDGFCDFSEKGLAGCECTWKWCFGDSQRQVPKAVTLIGDYDAWRHEHAPETTQFYEGLKTFQEPLTELWQILFDEKASIIQSIIDRGDICIQYRDQYCQHLLSKYSYQTSIDGVNAIALNVQSFGSNAFGEAFHEYPICIAYIYNGSQYVVSLYSKSVDVSLIAKKFGGGGHKGAAGFTCETLPFVEEK